MRHERRHVSAPVRMLAVAVLCAFGMSGCAMREPELPPIVEVFACGDYCPGPRQRYIVRVYQGVTDEALCETLGGRAMSYIGWGKHMVCLAE